MGCVGGLRFRLSLRKQLRVPISKGTNTLEGWNGYRNIFPQKQLAAAGVLPELDAGKHLFTTRF